MSKSKQIVLFIVEGHTDEEALAPVLSNLHRQYTTKDEIRFAVTYGDITSAEGADINSITQDIADKVDEYLFSERPLKISDIFRIVHILDTDGAFIPDARIMKQTGQDKPFYDDECILCESIPGLQKRNRRKSQIMRKLAGMRSVTYRNEKFLKGKKSGGGRKIPYQAFFLSCNLEHVLHNQRNVPDDQKADLAYAFADRYQEDLPGFVEFFNSDFAIQKNYPETWSYLYQGVNSLSRCSNFHIYLNQLVSPE